MDKCILNKGSYLVTTHIKAKGNVTDWMQNAFSFYVEAGLFYATGIEIPPSQSKILSNFEYTFQ